MTADEIRKHIYDSRNRFIQESLKLISENLNEFSWTIHLVEEGLENDEYVELKTELRNLYYRENCLDDNLELTKGIWLHFEQYKSYATYAVVTGGKEKVIGFIKSNKLTVYTFHLEHDLSGCEQRSSNLKSVLKEIKE